MMNEKDLQELKEMTGLVSESELNNTKREAEPAPCKPMYDRQAKAAIISKELAAYVGRFVKVGKTCGIIDDVHGNMLGYVHCENDTWTGELVWANETFPCTSDADIKKAYASALAYFTKERLSVKRRIDGKVGGVGEQATLAHMLWRIDKWLEKLHAKAA